LKAGAEEREKKSLSGSRRMRKKGRDERPKPSRSGFKKLKRRKRRSG
jgi:hypothetical protein